MLMGLVGVRFFLVSAMELKLTILNALPYQKSEKSDKKDTKTRMHPSRFVTTDTCYQSDSFAHS